MTPDRVLIVCARVSWPVPAVQTEIHGGGGRNNVILSVPGAENVPSGERGDVHVVRTTPWTSPPAVNLWRCSWCGARVKVVA